MHLSSASPSGGGTPGWCGDFANRAFQSSCISPTVGDFFLAKTPVLGEAKHPTEFEEALQNFILVLWTVSKHSDFLMKIELYLFFLEYYISCSHSGENFNFSSRPEFPRFCFKSIRTDEEQGKTHYHNGSLLLLNTTFLSFLSMLNGCCDASEINILVNIFKKINFFYP